MDESEFVPRRWDFATTLKSWLEVFGPEALCIGMFDRTALRAGDEVADFCYNAGIEDTPELDAPRDANRTPSWSTIEDIRYQNFLAANYGISEAFVESDPACEIAQAQSQITDLVASGNRWINATFFENQSVKLPEA